MKSDHLMIPISWAGRAALLLISLLPLPAIGQGAASGIITGRVSNAATQASLEAASVAIANSTHSVTTERDGTYRLVVPPGDYTLTVSYTGLDPQTVPVSIGANAVIRRDIALTSVIYQLDKFTVSGEREGTALAVTLQRRAPNVKSSPVTTPWPPAKDSFGLVKYFRRSTKWLI